MDEKAVEELTSAMARKTTESLQGVLAAPGEWTAEALEAVRRVLTVRRQTESRIESLEAEGDVAELGRLVAGNCDALAVSESEVARAEAALNRMRRAAPSGEVESLPDTPMATEPGDFEMPPMPTGTAICSSCGKTGIPMRNVTKGVLRAIGALLAVPVAGLVVGAIGGADVLHQNSQFITVLVLASIAGAVALVRGAWVGACPSCGIEPMVLLATAEGQHVFRHVKFRACPKCDKTFRLCPSGRHAEVRSRDTGVGSGERRPSTGKLPACRAGRYGPSEGARSSWTRARAAA